MLRVPRLMTKRSYASAKKPAPASSTRPILTGRWGGAMDAASSSLPMLLRSGVTGVTDSGRALMVKVPLVERGTDNGGTGVFRADKQGRASEQRGRTV